MRFAFASRPAAGLPITVSWLGPDGKLFGPAAELPNAPAVTAFLRAGESPTGLRSGSWRVVLRAGGKVVKTVRFEIA